MPIRYEVPKFSILKRITRRINQRIFQRDQILNCDDTLIILPPYHKLPQYLASADQYDRFLPILAGCLSRDGAIIDVGANCGDSLAFMHATNKTSQYIAIEPDPEFYSYLELNIAEIKKRDSKANITAIQKMIGKSILSADLSGSHGTKSAVIGSGEYKTIALDDIVDMHALKNIVLIKSDVDGYDYDVLASASSTIKENEPLIFFECLLNSSDQRRGYDTCISDLSSAGYCDWVVFDNHGHLLFRTRDASELRYIFDYTEKNRASGKYMPFLYVDILAGCEQHSAVITEALDLHDRDVKSAIP